MLVPDCKLVIYDCDGVIFDSLEANYAFYGKVLDRFGLPPVDRSDRAAMHMLHTHAVAHVLDELIADDTLRTQARDFVKSIDFRDLVPHMRLEEGFRETLEILHARVDLAVCTNRTTSTEVILQEFDISRYFGCVMTAAQVSNPKPHPEPLLKILQHYGIRADEALFVGDSELDLASARGAGVPFVAYRSHLDCPARIQRHQEILQIVG